MFDCIENTFLLEKGSRAEVMNEMVKIIKRGSLGGFLEGDFENILIFKLTIILLISQKTCVHLTIIFMTFDSALFQDGPGLYRHSNTLSSISVSIQTGIQ